MYGKKNLFFLGDVLVGPVRTVLPASRRPTLAMRSCMRCSHGEVNFNWVRGKNPVYGAGAECGGQETKTRGGVQSKGGLSLADPSGTFLASLSLLVAAPTGGVLQPPARPPKVDLLHASMRS